MQANPAEALQVLEQQEHAAMMQAEALLKVQEGLVNGCKWLWDEAARKLGTLLSSPAAFEGEHFLQVRIVTGRVLQIGSCLCLYVLTCWMSSVGCLPLKIPLQVWKMDKVRGHQAWMLQQRMMTKMPMMFRAHPLSSITIALEMNQAQKNTPQMNTLTRAIPL